MNYKSIVFGVCFFIPFLIKCRDKNSTVKDAVQNEASNEEVETSSYLTEEKQETLPKNMVIVGKDTIAIKESGKVFGVKAVDENIYFYSLFEATGPETDIGPILLKVVDKRSALLCSQRVENKIIRSSKTNIISINIETGCFNYYSIATGVNNRKICLGEHKLSDANEFVSTDKGLYIKLVNANDYSFEDILLMDGNNSQIRKLNISIESGYYKLIEKEGQVVLVDNESKVVKVIE